MSRPYHRPKPFTDLVARRGATSHKAGFDQARRIDNVERALSSHVGNDTAELNLYRALGSTVLTYTFDPCILVNTTDHTGGLTTGTTYASAVYLPQRATITGMGVYVETAGVGTWTICKVGLYSAAGTRLAVSTNDTSLYKSTGVTEKAFSSTYDAEKGIYYVAINNTRSATTTMPRLATRRTFSSGLVNLRTSSSYPRSVAMTDTDLSASYTWSSGALGGTQIFAYLY